MDKVLQVRSKIYDQFHHSAAGPDFFFKDVHADEYAAHYTSMYLIQDTGEAVWKHLRRGFSGDPLTAYLEFWGVMQALTIQQDAIRELHNAVVGSFPVTSTLSGWQAIRDTRNLCAGHPAKRSVGVPKTREPLWAEISVSIATLNMNYGRLAQRTQRTPLSIYER